MKIQQHDGVVVDAAGSRQGFAMHKREGEVLRREREVPRARSGCPPSLPLYIGARGRMPPWRSHLKGAARRPLGATAPLGFPNKGEHAPSGGNGPLGFPTLGALGPWVGRTSPSGAGSHATSAHGALQDRWPHPVDPRDPSGGPGTIPATPETFPMAETGLPIYIYLYLRTIPELLVTSGISSGTPNNFQVTSY